MTDRVPFADDALERRLSDYFESELDRARVDFRPLRQRPHRAGHRVLTSVSLAAALVVVAVFASLASHLLSERELHQPALGSPYPSVLASPSAPAVGLMENWVSVPLTGELSGATVAGMTSINGTFLAVGTSGGTVATAWISPDGLSWTKATLPTPQGIRSSAEEVVSNGRGSVALGWRMDTKGRTIPAAWNSSDGGKTWSETDLPTPPLASGHAGNFEPTAVASGRAGVVAFARCIQEVPGSACPATAYLWRSTDGTEWQLIPLPDASLDSLVAAGPGFVAGGTRDSGRISAIWVSSDGVSWSSVGDVALNGPASKGETLSIDRIAAGPTRLIALSPHSGGDAAAAAWSSADGWTWQFAADLSGRWFGLRSQPVWTSSGFLATGWVAPDVPPSGRPDPSVMARRDLLRSADGITWDVVPTPERPEGDGINAIAASSDRIVAATGHVILMSTDSTSEPSNANGTPSPAISVPGITEAEAVKFAEGRKSLDSVFQSVAAGRFADLDVHPSAGRSSVDPGRAVHGVLLAQPFNGAVRARTGACVALSYLSTRAFALSNS